MELLSGPCQQSVLTLFRIEHHLAYGVLPKGKNNSAPGYINRSRTEVLSTLVVLGYSYFGARPIAQASPTCCFFTFLSLLWWQALAYCCIAIIFIPYEGFLVRCWQLTQIFGEYITFGHGGCQTPFLKLHKQYGPVVRIAPNHLSFQSVDILNEVYKGGRKLPESDFYNGFMTFHPNTFGMLDEEVSPLPYCCGRAMGY